MWSCRPLAAPFVSLVVEAAKVLMLVEVTIHLEVIKSGKVVQEAKEVQMRWVTE